MESPPKLSRWQWCWPIALAAAISVASGRGDIAAPSWDFIEVDKAAHFAVFGLLATLIARMRTGWPFALAAVAIASGYGALDEWHQSFTPGRMVEVADWIADTAGAIAAVVPYTAWSPYRRALEASLGWRQERRDAGEPNPAKA
jgi:VanZ family protein